MCKTLSKHDITKIIYIFPIYVTMIKKNHPVYIYVYYTALTRNIILKYIYKCNNMMRARVPRKPVAQSFVNRIFVDLVDEMKKTTESYVFPHSNTAENIKPLTIIRYAREADELKRTKRAETFYSDVIDVLTV